MKIVAIPTEYRRRVGRHAFGDELQGIDYTSPPRRPRRIRRRPDEDIGNPSTIFPKASTTPAYVSDRNPHGTDYVQQLLARIDSGKYPHELDERRKPVMIEDEDELCVVREAS